MSMNALLCFFPAVIIAVIAVMNALSELLLASLVRIRLKGLELENISVNAFWDMDMEDKTVRNGRAVPQNLARMEALA